MSIPPEDLEAIEREIAYLESVEKKDLSAEMAKAISIAKQAAIAYRDGKKAKTFDWIKAVSILKDNNIKNADAGLIEDWSMTGGMIVECGDIHKTGKACFTSIWATPGLLIEHKDGTEEMIECWCYVEDATWDVEEVWPDEARKEFLNKPHFVIDGFGNEIELW